MIGRIWHDYQNNRQEIHINNQEYFHELPDVSIGQRLNVILGTDNEIIRCGLRRNNVPQFVLSTDVSQDNIRMIDFLTRQGFIGNQQVELELFSSRNGSLFILICVL